jgi:hypothetical protein
LPRRSCQSTRSSRLRRCGTDAADEAALSARATQYEHGRSDRNGTAARPCDTGPRAGDAARGLVPGASEQELTRGPPLLARVSARLPARLRRGDEAGVPVRLVLGAFQDDQDPKPLAHSWLDLPDETIIDPRSAQMGLEVCAVIPISDPRRGWYTHDERSRGTRCSKQRSTTKAATSSSPQCVRSERSKFPRPRDAMACASSDAMRSRTSSTATPRLRSSSSE